VEPVSWRFLKFLSSVSEYLSFPFRRQAFDPLLPIRVSMRFSTSTIRHLACEKLNVKQETPERKIGINKNMRYQKVPIGMETRNPAVQTRQDKK